MRAGSATMSTALFEIGQIVHHRLFGYRGVVLDVDADFQGGDEWYENRCVLEESHLYIQRNVFTYGTHM